jgi:nicotinamidase-related amidase
MPELSHIDPGSAALLVMDYQVDTLTRFMTAAQSADAIASVPALIAIARDAGMMVIHVVVAFRPGHPEVIHGLQPRSSDATIWSVTF